MKTKTDRPGSIHKNQRGITLLELMIAIALAGIVTAGITLIISNVLGQSTRTSNQRIALSQVQSAGYWLTRDARQAEPPPGSQLGEYSGFPLSLTWLEGPGAADSPRHFVIYDVEDDGRLRRTHKIGSEPQADTVIAEHIVPYATSCDWAGGAFVFEVTAAVGNTDVTMIYEVKPRLG